MKGNAAAAVLAIAVYVVGTNVLLPGLDYRPILAEAGSSGDTRLFSVFAIGVMPFFTVLATWELARLIFPGLARWQKAAARNETAVATVIRVLAIMIAATQAYGITQALTAYDVVSDAAVAFVPVGIFCLVGGTAILIWLIDRIRISGLGNSFWLFMVIPTLAVLPRELSATFELARFGAIPPVYLLFVAVFLIVAVVLVVLASSVLAGDPTRGEKSIDVDVFFWPPYLASLLTGYLMIVPVFLFPALISPASFVFVAIVTCLLIPLMVFLYARPVLREVAAADRTRLAARFAVIAGMQAIVCLLAAMITFGLAIPLNLNGTVVIALTGVALAVAGRLPATSGRRHG